MTRTEITIWGIVLFAGLLFCAYQGPVPVGSMALTAEDCAKPGAKCYANQ